MRHRKSVKSLGRTSSHRKSMLSNMGTSLILHKRIRTTLAKARVLRSFIEPLITRSKEDTTHNRRIAFGYLRDKHAVTELFREVSLKVADRPGGYTRILKTENRLGDNAQMCIIELVDYNELYVTDTPQKKTAAKRTRRGRGKGVAADADTAPTPTVATQEEAPEAVVEDVTTEPEVVADTPAEVEEEAPEAQVEVEAEAETEEAQPEAAIEDVATETEPEETPAGDEETKTPEATADSEDGEDDKDASNEEEEKKAE